MFRPNDQVRANGYPLLLEAAPISGFETVSNTGSFHKSLQRSKHVLFPVYLGESYLRQCVADY
jgi:hypothetical protein